MTDAVDRLYAFWHKYDDGITRWSHKDAEGRFAPLSTPNPHSKGNGNMDTNIVPVEETEMRQFFDKVATQFVSLSTQSRELQELKAQFGDLSTRLDRALNENQDLKRDITDTWNSLRRIEEERDAARNELNVLRVELDRVKHELEYVMSERDRHAQNASERHEAVQLLTREVEDSHNRINSLSRDVDNYIERATYVEKERDDLKSKVDTMRSLFNPPVPVQVWPDQAVG